MSKPTPIDNNTLPFDQKKAVKCWRYNRYTAIGNHTYGSPVDAVWATRTCIYWEKPPKTGYANGSRDIGTLYATESEAWEACIVSVQDFFTDRLDKLRDMAGAARKQDESPSSTEGAGVKDE